MMQTPLILTLRFTLLLYDITLAFTRSRALTVSINLHSRKKNELTVISKLVRLRTPSKASDQLVKLVCFFKSVISHFTLPDLSTNTF